MDVERIVHLDRSEHPADGSRSSLGHSIGHFEDDTLVIETANYAAGVLSQYVETPAPQVALGWRQLAAWPALGRGL
jgi:hypothetical protein